MDEGWSELNDSRTSVLAIKSFESHRASKAGFGAHANGMRRSLPTSNCCNLPARPGCGPTQVVDSKISGSVLNVDIEIRIHPAYPSLNRRRVSQVHNPTFHARIDAVKDIKRQRLVCRAQKCMYLPPDRINNNIGRPYALQQNSRSRVFDGAEVCRRHVAPGPKRCAAWCRDNLPHRAERQVPAARDEYSKISIG